jgi:hypothetical protein
MTPRRCSGTSPARLCCLFGSRDVRRTSTRAVCSSAAGPAAQLEDAAGRPGRVPAALATSRAWAATQAGAGTRGVVSSKYLYKGARSMPGGVRTPVQGSPWRIDVWLERGDERRSLLCLSGVRVSKRNTSPQTPIHVRPQFTLHSPLLSSPPSSAALDPQTRGSN